MDTDAEICAVLYRYAHAYDDGDLDAAIDCFTVDAEMWVSTRSEPVRGHSELRRFFGAARDGRRQAGTQPRHLIANVLVAMSADGVAAHTRAYMALTLSGAGGARIDCTGVYRDRLVPTADGWRFQERHLTFDPAA
jgi:3-phenylpropionate/cinnamic acid dioxygenase small subunit